MAVEPPPAVGRKVRSERLDGEPRGRNISDVEQQFQVSRTAGTAGIDRGAELLVRVLESPEPAALAGPAILRVAERGMLERNLVDLSSPSLDRLSDDTGETINLAVPGFGGVEHLAQVDSTYFLGAGQWVGQAVDYHCTAVGKVFLAFGSAVLPSEPLRSMTAHTVI